VGKKETKSRLNMIRYLLFVVALGSVVASEGPTVVNLCRVLEAPAKYAGTEITVRATIRPSLHGTYLSQTGCDEVLFMALPAETPNRKAMPEIERNSGFQAFERARRIIDRKLSDSLLSLRASWNTLPMPRASAITAGTRPD